MAVGPIENFIVVIEWMSIHWGEHPISEIVEGTGLSRGQVRGVLKSGSDAGWLRQDPNGFVLEDRLGLMGDRYRRRLLQDQLALQERIERLGDNAVDFLTRRSG